MKKLIATCIILGYFGTILYFISQGIEKSILETIGIFIVAATGAGLIAAPIVWAASILEK